MKSKMDISKQTILMGKENRLKHMKKEIGNLNDKLNEHVKAGDMDWVANESARLHDLALEAKLLKQDIADLNEVYSFLEKN